MVHMYIVHGAHVLEHTSAYVLIVISTEDLEPYYIGKLIMSCFLLFFRDHYN